MNCELMFSSKTDQWATPQDTFDELNKEFSFDLDPCADKQNHKCEKYFTVEEDGLKQNWGGHRVFCNPPYGRDLKAWVEKSYHEGHKENTLVTLVTNADKITGGAEEEDDESLRLRIAEYDETSGESFVGCDADYIRWAKEVSGVGTVLVDAQYEKTHPNWVRLIILDSSGEPANGSIIQNVYDHIMRDDNRIERKAPVGAILLVQAPEGEVVNISVEGLQLDGAKTAAEVEEIFRTALIEYYITAKADSLVKYNEIHAALTRTEGVKNFSKILVNGDVKDIPLDPADYPCTGEIHGIKDTEATSE